MAAVSRRSRDRGKQARLPLQYLQEAGTQGFGHDDAFSGKWCQALTPVERHVEFFVNEHYDDGVFTVIRLTSSVYLIYTLRNNSPSFQVKHICKPRVISWHVRYTYNHEPKFANYGEAPTLGYIASWGFCLHCRKEIPSRTLKLIKFQKGALTKNLSL